MALQREALCLVGKVVGGLSTTQAISDDVTQENVDTYDGRVVGNLFYNDSLLSASILVRPISVE
jgi:hypothetical protein